MISKITARFDSIDAADRAAARIQSRIEDIEGIHGFPVGENTVSGDPEMAELDMLVVPFPTQAPGYGAAIINDADDLDAEFSQYEIPQEAALIVTAPKDSMSEINSIITNSGGYFCHIEDLTGGEDSYY